MGMVGAADLAPGPALRGRLFCIDRAAPSLSRGRLDQNRTLGLVRHDDGARRLGHIDTRPGAQTSRPSRESASHPIASPSDALAALGTLEMAHATAAVRAMPAHPMTASSGAPNCRK